MGNVFFNRKEEENLKMGNVFNRNEEEKKIQNLSLLDKKKKKFINRIYTGLLIGGTVISIFFLLE